MRVCETLSETLRVHRFHFRELLFERRGGEGRDTGKSKMGV